MVLSKTMRWIAAAGTAVPLAFISVAGQHARAENEPKEVTLSCDGKVTDTHINESKTYSAAAEVLPTVGVIVNLDKRTVSFLGYVAQISSVDAAYIGFGGEQLGGHPTGVKVNIMGEIDRVTGRMDAMTTTTESPTTMPGYLESHYEMVCKATSRVF